MRHVEPRPGRILILEHKHGTYPVFARTEEEDAAAHLHLFKFMDEVGFYKCYTPEDQKDLYEQAKQGDEQAARDLLQIRSDYEYERVYVEYVETPKP